ncbi:hypothetical protein ACFYY8_41960 [Streptosporangium sp. NPDC001559]|uniref:hypothetical protein n=1 Tax=Streptosporangium sp. NPDC001559 TaxID=3366187 RepID=UPI0036EA8AED
MSNPQRTKEATAGRDPQRRGTPDSSTARDGLDRRARSHADKQQGSGSNTKR